MELSEQEQAILRLICYFDVLALPLSWLDSLRLAGFKSDLPEIAGILESLKQKNIIERQDGLYFLSGKKILLENKRRRQLISAGLFKKTALIGRALSYLPWVRGLAVYSSLSFANATEKSDIDLFVVAAAGRVWSARFFINIFLKFFSLRPVAGKSSGKICVSFLADENHLDLSKLKDNNEGHHYSYGETHFLFIYDEAGAGKKFFSDNGWISVRFPNFYPCQAGLRRFIAPADKTIKKIIELCASIFPEKLLHRLQLRLLPPQIKKLEGRDWRVVLGDHLIKLHLSDRREEIDKRTDDLIENICDCAN